MPSERIRRAVSHPVREDCVSEDQKNFENLDTVLYDDPTLKDDRAAISSTILINHR